jgi:hypothetical protein
MERVTFRDHHLIQTLNEHAVVLRLEASRHPTLFAHYGGQGVPFLVWLRPDGSVLDRQIGFRTPSQVLAPLAYAQ